MRYTAECVNYKIRENRFADLIAASEEKHKLQFENLVRMITESHRFSLNRNITDAVLITGPSSSGKTTASKLLAAYLTEFGFNTILISFDDYYHDLSHIRELQGKHSEESVENLDLECPEAFDIAFFRQQMGEFLSGNEITLPVYDFLRKKRIQGRTITPTDKDVIIIEGIHALNPLLTEGVNFSKTFKVYICPFDVYSVFGSDVCLRPQNIRFMRRSVRDRIDRNSSLDRTLRMWPSVRAGEERYIKPMKIHADYFFNSSLEYEICLLKHRFMKLLADSDGETQEKFRDLFPLEILEQFESVPEAEIPEDSIFREFYK